MHICGKITFLILSLISLSSAAESTFANPGPVKSFQAYAQSETITIWKTPGFTDEDCESLKNPALPTMSGSPSIYFSRHLRRIEKACKDRIVLSVSSGEIVYLVATSKGKKIVPVETIKNVLYQGEIEKRKYIKGSLGSHPDIKGWISREQISETEERIAQLDLANLCKNCTGMRKFTTGLSEQTNEIAFAEQALDFLNLLSPSDINFKNQAEIDRFVCLHRAPHGPESETKAFLNKSYGKFKNAAEQAEKAFGVPKQLVLCGILAESNYKPGQQSDAGARGYAQIMPQTMTTISKIPQMQKSTGDKSYQEMWNEYISDPSTKESALNNLKVRRSDHIGSNVGAMALYFRYLFDSYLKTVKENGKCKDCTADLENLSRKDIYLLLTGYNAGPSYISRVSNKTPPQLKRTNPPPKETNKFIEKIEKCLEEGKETSFSETQTELENISIQRHKEIKQLQAEIKTLKINFEYHNKIHLSREKRIAAYKKAQLAKKTDPKIVLPAKVAPYPKPESPDIKIKERQDRINFLTELNKQEANASYGKRLDMCNETTPIAQKETSTGGTKTADINN